MQYGVLFVFQEKRVYFFLHFLTHLYEKIASGYRGHHSSLSDLGGERL